MVMSLEVWAGQELLSEFIEGMSFEETLESPNDPEWAALSELMKANIRLYQYF